jgi:hypothetical protein
MNLDLDRERTHLRVWGLLPWVVNGRASEVERAEVDAHLADCECCHAEFRLATSLAVAMNASRLTGPDVDEGLERLWQRIDQVERQQTELPHEKRHTLKVAGGLWMAVACALGVVTLVQAGYFAVLEKRDARELATSSYRTLSSQPSDAIVRATIRLVIDPSMPSGKLQSLLALSHLQILGGPSDSGVYSLGPTSASADVAKQLDTLRTASGVRFAEPVQRFGAP